MAFGTGTGNSSRKFSTNSGSSFKKPAAAGATGAAAGAKKDRKPTTHYMVTASDDKGEKNFVNGVFITETQYGLQVSVAASIQPGLYFVNKKKDKDESAE